MWNARCGARSGLQWGILVRQAAARRAQSINAQIGQKEERKGETRQRKGESQTNDALSQCAHVCGPLLRSRKQICVVTTPTTAAVPSFFLPLQRRSQTIERRSGATAEGRREGDNIQNGFLMGGNHSPMIRMTLPRKRETMGDGERANRCLFCAPFRYNRHIPKTAAAIITGPTPECMIVSPRGLEHSSRKGLEEEEGDDIGDKAKGCLSSGGRKRRGEERGASAI